MLHGRQSSSASQLSFILPQKQYK